LSGHVSTAATEDLMAAGSNVQVPMADPNDVIQDSLQFMPGGHHASGLHMPYSAFASGDGSSWTAVMDPTMMAAAGFGFPGSSMIPGQYIVGSEMIWNQDPLLMGYQFLNAIPLEQTANVQLDPTTSNSVDSIGQITPAFGAISINGSMQGVSEPVPVTISANTLDTTKSVESTASASAPAGSASQAQNSAPQPEKPKSWAAVASQPAKPRPPPPVKVQPQQEVSDVAKKSSNPPSRQVVSQSHKGSANVPASNSNLADEKQSSTKKTSTGGLQGGPQPASKGKAHQSGIVSKLHSQNKYNPSELTLNLTNARYFVIKSYAEDDIHRSIKYSMWTSTEHGNRRLDQAFKEQKGKPVFLFYSVNGSGHFCGMAQMKSEVDFHNATGVWAQDKWKGRFDVKWFYVKDVPNSQLRHIRLENNENKPVTNSRDTQEIPSEKGKQVVKIIHSYSHTTSIFDDFEHYEKKQLEDSQKKK
jgi:hypothetical protein